MKPVKSDPFATLSKELLQAFDDLNGLHPGSRPVHAKGILLAGTFRPSPAAKSLTTAPHIQAPTTPVTVRFSDFAGIPTIPDNDSNASPRGVAIRFHLGEHVHTDIIAHSIDGFPVRTAEEFVEFLRAAAASAHTGEHPNPIEKFLGAYPAALKFVQTPQPLPVSFVKESYYAVNSYCFIDGAGTRRYGRYRIRPEGTGEYLDQAAAGAKSPNFLFEEIRARLGDGPAKMRIVVQVAEKGDVVNDATAHWPNDRPEVEFGTVELEHTVENGEAEQRHIIFDPIPRVAGIEASEDPLLEPRASVYLMSGRRRRASGE